MRTVDAVAGTLYLHDPEAHKLVFQYVVGEKSRELTGVAIDDSVGTVGSVFHSGDGLIINQPRTSHSHRPEIGNNVGFTTESILTVPLRVQHGQPVGVIQLLNKRGGEFQSYDLEVLEIVASIAAAAIENSRLYDEAQLAAIAHRVAHLSHDIKNKVTPISMTVQTLEPIMATMLEDLDQMAAGLPSEVAAEVHRSAADLRTHAPECFSIIMDQVHEVKAYTELIANTLKGGSSEPEMVVQELNPLLERQITSLLPVAKRRRVSLSLELTPIPPFAFDRFRLECAVYNLINNAIPETPANGRVTVRSLGPHKLEGDERTFVTIEVQDTGRGIPHEKLDEILKGKGRSNKPGGTGLGTLIVYNAAKDHCGIYDGESAPGMGTTFRMHLPFRS
jgi:signal transduction histidine kinase